MRVRLFVLAVSVISTSIVAGAQQTSRPTDTATRNAPITQSEAQKMPVPPSLTPTGLDDFVAQLYNVISGPAGQKRDPDKFRSLFVKNTGRLLVSGKNPQTGNMDLRILTPDDYIDRSFPYLEKNGFYEKEIARRTERFGSVVHIWSTYESRHKPDEQPFARGINSIDVYQDPQLGWQIVQIMWEGERPGNPLPQEYLHSH